MALAGSDKAYTWARSALARSGATRSNYVMPWTGADLIRARPDATGAIVSRVDLVPDIRAGSLRVTQAINDEPDTCAFQIVPTAPSSAVPRVGNEIQISWAPGAVEFQGYVLVVQFDRRPMNQSPWISVQCQDSMWRFDARIVTYPFPAQSVSASIAYLVQWFCTSAAPYTVSPFSTAFVQPDMPSLPSVDVINQRPSTVMRRLLAAVQGGFYIDGFDVHAWAGSASEPAQTNPAPLVNALPSLKAFRLTHDATQLRRRVLVEGRRTTTLIGYPAMGPTGGVPLGLPISDASIFAPATGPSADHATRIGSQWIIAGDPVTVTAGGANPPQTRLAVDFVPGATILQLEPMPVAPPAAGWIRISGQSTRYGGYSGDPLTGVWLLFITDPTAPYGALTVPIPKGESVYWLDAVMRFEPNARNPNDASVRPQPVDTPVVTFAEAYRSTSGWPMIEGFVQDGRYSYTGALDRANDDLDAFAEPLVSADWETEDLNARPGRVQAIHLTGASVIDPVDLTLTIMRVELSFPLRTLPPRRQVSGGAVKPSTFLDLVVTDLS